MSEQGERKVVLVTGAGRGIGAAIAEKFMDEGCDVILNYRRSYGKGAANIERLVERGEARGVRAFKVRADIAEQREVEAMMRQIRAAGFEHIDHLVLNAAASTFKRFSEMTKSDWKVLLGTNLIGNVSCVNHVTPMMRPGSTICALTSLGGRMVLDRYPLGVMKAALEHLVRYMAVELKEQRIRVNGVCAGFTNTDMLPILMDVWSDMAERQENATSQWLIEPEEVANVVSFLASPLASAINAEIVLADAGISVGAGAPLENQAVTETELEAGGAA